jgi:hypothetical protein
VTGAGRDSAGTGAADPLSAVPRDRQEKQRKHVTAVILGSTGEHGQAVTGRNRGVRFARGGNFTFLRELHAG